MILFPAIDIRGGRAVQLVQGDFDRETAYDADPVDAARRWEAAGTEWIHIVDLDGARSGSGANRDAIARIRTSVSCRLQVGGGLRSLDTIDELLASSIDRVILGSIAVTDPSVVIAAVERHGDRIAVGLDARDGKLATSGWETQTDADAFETARQMGEEGVKHIVFTDIRRDGTFTGPNVDALRTMVASTSASVIASGGIGSSEDVIGLRDTGVAGVIIGSALYDGRIDLAALLEQVSREHAGSDTANSSQRTRNARTIKASPEAVYRAFTDPAALEVWQAPDTMTGKVHRFDGRVGGGYEMSLYYADSDPGSPGKTSEREDRYSARFLELVPSERIVQGIVFDTSDPAFMGEMTMAITLEPEATGTTTTVEFENIPPGIRPEDNEVGTDSSLEKLARYVEQQAG